MDTTKLCSNFLRSKYIHVQQDWLEACISWLHEENGNAALGREDLCSQLYEQWLLSDLSEIGMPVLSEQMQVVKNFMLKDNFTVQVNYLYDIGHSAYSQYSALQGQAVEDVCDDDNDGDNDVLSFSKNKSSGKSKERDKPNNNWKEESCRMLFFSLQDGGNEFEAVEYRPIAHLNVDLIPGSKLLLKGPLWCVNGVILLQQFNVELLGGSSEQQMVDMSRTNILMRILNISDTKKETDPGETERPNNDSSAPLEDNLQIKHETSVGTDCHSLNNELFVDDWDFDVAHIEEKIVPGLGVNDSQCSIKSERINCDSVVNVPEIAEQLLSETEFASEVLQEFDLENNTLQNFQPCSRGSIAPVNKPDVPSSDIVVTLENVLQRKDLFTDSWIMGRFVTLLSQLEFGNGYSLDAVITDDSESSAHVHIANEALEELIGFSSSYMNSILCGSTDEGQKYAIKDTIEQCEQKLASCYWFIKLCNATAEQSKYDLKIMKMTPLST